MAAVVDLAAASKEIERFKEIREQARIGATGKLAGRLYVRRLSKCDVLRREDFRG